MKKRLYIAVFSYLCMGQGRVVFFNDWIIMTERLLKRKTGLLLFAAITAMMLGSCFKDEPDNAECDIEKAWIHFDNPLECVWSLNDTIHEDSALVNRDLIVFKVRPGTDCSRLAPLFKLTPGAAIFPQNGSTHDFTDDTITYTVTSQDKEWQRTYRVAVQEQRRTSRDIINYHFEHFDLYEVPNSTAKYYTWHEMLNDKDREEIWASGNGGFRLSNFSARPEEFPTTPLEQGYSGHGVQLVTRKTGPLAQAVNKRIAAGNIFLGSFDQTNALKDAMRATRFGIRFDKKPLSLSGWYKYRSGDVFQNQDGSAVQGKRDAGTIYAVLYRNTDEVGHPVTLYGDDVLTSRYIVAKAVVNNIEATDGWTHFSADFDYRGKDVDYTLLSEFGYNLTIVCSSSIDGAYFQGAIGSTLCVDELTLTCETELAAFSVR